MRPGTETLGRWTGHVAYNWERVHQWSLRTFTRDRLADIALGISTLSITGLIVLALYRAMEHRAVGSSLPF